MHFAKVQGTQQISPKKVEHTTMWSQRVYPPTHTYAQNEKYNV